MSFWNFIVFNFKKSPMTFLNPPLMVPFGYTVSALVRHNFNIIWFFSAIGIGLFMSALSIGAVYIILKVQKRI